MLDIGKTLRKYRDINCHSQQFVADCIGISRAAYRKWENNEIIFTIVQLQRISELYDVAMEEIIRESYSDKLLKHKEWR